MNFLKNRSFGYITNAKRNKYAPKRINWSNKPNIVDFIALFDSKTKNRNNFK